MMDEARECGIVNARADHGNVLGNSGFGARNRTFPCFETVPNLV
jgi:hypothetical protein